MPEGFFFSFWRGWGIFLFLFFILEQRVGVFHFSKTILCSCTRGEMKTNIFSQWSSRQETIVLIMSGTVVIPLFLSKQFTCAPKRKMGGKKRAVPGHEPGRSPRFHVVRHLCARRNLAAAVRHGGRRRRRSREVTRRWRTDCVQEEEINASLSHNTNLEQQLRLWFRSTSNRFSQNERLVRFKSPV